jgi:hypothetical protein
MHITNTVTITNRGRPSLCNIAKVLRCLSRKFTERLPTFFRTIRHREDIVEIGATEAYIFNTTVCRVVQGNGCSGSGLCHRLLFLAFFALVPLKHFLIPAKKWLPSYELIAEVLLRRCFMRPRNVSDPQFNL